MTDLAVDRAHALAGLGILDTAAEPRFDVITRSAAELTGTAMAAVNFVDATRQFTKAFCGLDLAGSSVPVDESICRVPVASGRTLVVEDLAADPRFAELPAVAGDPHLRFYAGEPRKAPTGEVVGSLCVMDVHPREFDARERRVLRNLADWVERELVVDQELEQAAHVQRALLPSEPLALPGFDVAGGCRPALGAGGDFYDWYLSAEGAQITLGDVMGKGVGAAILAASVRAFLRGYRRLDVASAVKSTADSLADEFDETGSFATLFHLRLSEDGRMDYVDAGHGPARVVRADGRLEALRSPDRPIGILPEDTWTPQTLVLEPGDTLLIASDGILDRVQPGDTADEELIAIVRTAASSQAVVDHYLAAAITSGYGRDDTTQLVIRRVA